MSLPRPQSASRSSDQQALRAKILGCWLGKAVGGTLGGPVEGHEGPHDLHFYDPVPTTMIPNDDLDLQVVWACALAADATPVVSRHRLAQAWIDHVGFPFDEYGIALRNLRAGIAPPWSGRLDNTFTRGMGAAIRSELWACLAPGDPRRAAAFAYEDACVDHDGEGIWAEVFFAALESQAFVESDQDALLDCALAFLPAGSAVRLAISDTRRWWAETGSWLRVRERILDHHGHENFTDVAQNLAITILAWLAHPHDFSRAICTAVNCGKDTDCTGATLGALLGILDPDCIGRNWLEPIGRDLVLSPPIIGLRPPATIDGFTDLVLELGQRVQEHREIEPPQPANPFAVRLTMHDSRWFAAQGGPVPTDGFASGRPCDAPGSLLRLPLTAFRGEALLLHWDVSLPQAQGVLLLAQATTPLRAWIDGEYACGREHGPFTPSPHRYTPGTWAERKLTAGQHRISLLVQRPLGGEVLIAYGLADQRSRQWLPPLGR